MRVVIHIGLPQCGAFRLQSVLHDKRRLLADQGVLFPASPGRRNHDLLAVTATDPDHVDRLRWLLGFSDPKAHANLMSRTVDGLKREIDLIAPNTLVLSAEQFGGSLYRRDELHRLKEVLAPFATEFQIVAHVDEQARVLARHYAEQVLLGRVADLGQELTLVAAENWRAACLTDWDSADPALNALPEVQSAPFWLDYVELVRSWEKVFGKGAVRLRPYAPDLFYSDQIARELSAAFDFNFDLGPISTDTAPNAPSAHWLARSRQMNELFQLTLQTGRKIPQLLWRRMLDQFSVPGAPISPGSLHAISDRFASDNAMLHRQHPALSEATLAPDPTQTDWQETPVGGGFRAAQYMAAFLPTIDRATRQEDLAPPARSGSPVPPSDDASGEFLSPSAAELLTPIARANFDRMKNGRFAPHNNIGRVNETVLAAPFSDASNRPKPQDSSGVVLVACMKNEGPYILEWLAYHQSIGVDNFLIYANDCSDGTVKILSRLQELGHLHLRRNDDWRGKSPQQHALNRSLKEDLILRADWIIHIDVDEFINVRTGNGMLADLFACVPDATNIAMTWRMFGHNGVQGFEDRPVIDQFDTCAPKYCPKPHTVWGFKTMFRNIGAYNKISCHRPNKLNDSHRDRVKWVNGSGLNMGEPIKDRGWRSELRTIGYDLVQLNHYALRSADSFLIKRQRGRALHVDRSIGLNYWIRMDWSDQKDLTIKRNLPRMLAQRDALLSDPKLAELHRQAVNWHKRKAAELHKIPEFQALYDQVLKIRLTEMERVAYATSTDTDS